MKKLPASLLFNDDDECKIKPASRVFTVGNLYRISGNPDFYVFQYAGKQGIHHCFRKVHGKWTQTYTDCQLLDKKVEEIL